MQCSCEPAVPAPPQQSPSYPDIGRACLSHDVSKTRSHTYCMCTACTYRGLLRDPLVPRRCAHSAYFKMRPGSSNAGIQSINPCSWHRGEYQHIKFVTPHSYVDSVLMQGLCYFTFPPSYWTAPQREQQQPYKYMYNMY